MVQAVVFEEAVSTERRSAPLWFFAPSMAINAYGGIMLFAPPPDLVAEEDGVPAANAIDKYLFVRHGGQSIQPLAARNTVEPKTCGGVGVGSG